MVLFTALKRRTDACIRTKSQKYGVVHRAGGFCCAPEMCFTAECFRERASISSAILRASRIPNADVCWYLKYEISQIVQY